MATTKKVKYTRAEGYRIFPATGAFGGPSPNGDITVDFYVERFQVPNEENLIIDDTTKTALPSQPIETDISRESQVGIVLRRDTAFFLGKFLMDKALMAGFVPPPDDR